MATMHSPVSPRSFMPLSPATRLTAEFREMPGLQLNAEQTAKLIGVDVPTASALLITLVQRGYLRVISTGYIRA